MQPIPTKIALIKRMLLIALVGSILGMMLTQDKMGYLKGVCFGTLFSILKLQLIDRTFNKIVHMPPKRAQSYSLINYVARYVLTGIVLLVSALEPSIHILGTVVGLLTMKLAVFISLLHSKRKDKLINNH